MVIQVNNYINGDFEETSEYYEVKDYSGNTIVAKLPVSTSLDLRKTLRSSKHLQEKLESTSIEKRIDIIKKIYYIFLEKVKANLKEANLLHGTIDDDVLEPLKSLEEWINNLDEFQNIALGSSNALAEGVDLEYKGEKISSKYYVPRGPVSIILPANMESSEQFYVLAQSILSGNHPIVRISKKDITTPLFFEAISELDFPQGGQLISWPSSNENALDLTRRLIKMTAHSIIFASNTTINNLLLVKDESENIIEDLSKSNLIYKYGSGLPVVIVTANADLKSAASGLVLGAIDGKGSHCISTTPVYVSEKIYDELINLVLFESSFLKSHNESRKFSPQELNSLKQFIESDKHSFEKIHGNISEEHSDLIILENVTSTSRFLHEEIPAMVLAFHKVKDLEKSITHANLLLQERGLKKHILGVVYGNFEDYMITKKNLKAHMIKSNEHTTNFNWFLPHQGSYFMVDLLEVIN